MSKPRASSLYACVFVKTPSRLVYEYDAAGNATAIKVENLTADELRAWGVANEAATMLYEKYQVVMDVNICAYDYGQNDVIAERAKLYTLPGILVTATYPDGSRGQYALRKELNEKFFGINWKATDVYPYYEALYLQQSGQPSLLCKIFPPLCQIGAYAWLAAAAVSTYKAVEQKKNAPLATVWGAGALLSFNEFQSKGGFDLIFKKK
jgi:hypothetical protein